MHFMLMKLVFSDHQSYMTLSSCSTNGTLCVTLVSNQVIRNEEERTWNCLRQVEHIRGHLLTQIFRKTFEVMTST
jgi:hypothetical protein